MANYSIWVLEYAYVPSYHVSGIVYGAHNQGYRKLPYCYVLIKGQGTVAMVDVGYNEKDVGAEMARRFGVEASQNPETVLKQAGVKPEEVEHSSSATRISTTWAIRMPSRKRSSICRSGSFRNGSGRWRWMSVSAGSISRPIRAM